MFELCFFNLSLCCQDPHFPRRVRVLRGPDQRGHAGPLHEVQALEQRLLHRPVPLDPAGVTRHEGGQVGSLLKQTDFLKKKYTLLTMQKIGGGTNVPKNNENIFCNALFQRETLPKTNILKPPSSISKEPV